MEQDYIYLRSEDDKDFYRAVPRIEKFSEPWLGRFVDSYSIPEAGLGVCEVIGKGYYAVIWRDHYGPYPTRGEAETNLKAIQKRNIDVYSHEDPLGCIKGIGTILMIYGGLALVGCIGWLIYQAWESFQ